MAAAAVSEKSSLTLHIRHILRPGAAACRCARVGHRVRGGDLLFIVGAAQELLGSAIVVGEHELRHTHSLRLFAVKLRTLRVAGRRAAEAAEINPELAFLELLDGVLEPVCRNSVGRQSTIESDPSPTRQGQNPLPHRTTEGWRASRCLVCDALCHVIHPTKGSR